MNTVLSKATIEMVENGSGAEPTCRLTNNGLTEWRADAMIDDVPVSVYYMTSDDDTASADANEDLGLVDWDSCVDRIEINIAECDRLEIEDAEIEKLAKKLN